MSKLSAIRDTCGQTLIEVSLALPVLLLLLFGAAEYGRLAYVGVEVTNAAHAGAVYGSQDRGTAANNTLITTAATNDGWNLTNMTVTSQDLCAATYSDTPTTAACNTGIPAIVYVQVNTQVTVSSLFSGYTNGKTYTLHGQAIERVRGDWEGAAMSVRRTFLRSERGTSLVEAALSTSLLLGLLFGAMLSGYMLYTYHFLSYAARAGARYAMVRGANCDNSNGMPDCPNVTSDQVQTYVRSFRQLGIDPNQLTVTATWPQGDEKPTHTVNVLVTYPFPLQVPFVISRTVNMQSTAQMVISQ
jgi:Flp pilus assembly protein TadG